MTDLRWKNWKILWQCQTRWFYKSDQLGLRFQKLSIWFWNFQNVELLEEGLACIWLPCLTKRPGSKVYGSSYSESFKQYFEFPVGLSQRIWNHFAGKRFDRRNQHSNFQKLQLILLLKPYRGQSSWGQTAHRKNRWNLGTALIRAAQWRWGFCGCKSRRKFSCSPECAMILGNSIDNLNRQRVFWRNPLQDSNVKLPVQYPDINKKKKPGIYRTWHEENWLKILKC